MEINEKEWWYIPLKSMLDSKTKEIDNSTAKYSNLHTAISVFYKTNIKMFERLGHNDWNTA